MDVALLLTEEFIAAQPLGVSRHQVTKRSHPGVLPSGKPTQGASDVIGEVLSVLGARAANVTLVLPARLIRTSRLMLDISVGGTVRQSHLTSARHELASATTISDSATLYRQPSGFLLDGVKGSGDPVGQPAHLISVDGISMSAQMRVLSAFERVITDAGAQLVDVVVPHLTTAAAALDGEGTGTLLHMSQGDVLLVDMRNHFVVAAASLPLGFRHLANDVRIADDCSEEDAAGRVRTMMQRLPTVHPVPAEKALDARLGELGDWVRDVISVNEVSGPLIFNGALSNVHRLSEVWDDLPIRPSLMGIRGSIAPLLGVDAVLSGEYGAHEPAKLGTAINGLPGGQILRWLQTHF